VSDDHQKNGQFKKGHKRIAGSGRDKGTPNTKSVAVKEALEQVFEKMDGIEGLFKFAKENPKEFYLLWVKMLPKDIQADITTNGEAIASITSEQAVLLVTSMQKKLESAS